jgi:fatty-acyl-CoA synthase
VPDPLNDIRASTLGEAVLRSAQRHPERVALRCGDDVVTFAELADRARRLAGALLGLGVEAGDRVVIAMHNCVEVVESYVACHVIGACAVPVNFRLAPAEVGYQVGHCRASAILVDTALEPIITGLALDIPVLSLSGSYQRARDASAPADPAVVDGDDLAFVIYTSGTTGRPKGAMLTHRNLAANTANWIAAVGATGDDVWLSGLPLFHIGGINGVLPFLMLGTTVIITPSGAFDPAEALDRMRRHRVTMCFFVPTQWQAICEVARTAAPRSATASDAGVDAVTGDARVDAAEPRTTLDSLRIAMWGGSQASIATLEAMEAAFPGVGIINAFGQTEMSSNTCMLMPVDAVRKIGSIGVPLPGVEVRVVDEQMRDVAVDEVGEIVYRGPTVMAGYLDDEAATTEALRGGWFHSGDLVRRDVEGYLYVVDRRTDMIVSGGENIYPAEVERALLEDPRVRDVAVVGAPHPRWGHAPVAVVVADGPGLTGADVVEIARARLASYKKPQAVVFVDELPRNAAGKVLRRELRERLAATFAPTQSSRCQNDSKNEAI